MIKFAVIIPFRPKAESNDWQRESSLLVQTIQSVLRQTYDALKIFVVYTDLPAQTVSDERVEYVLFPYGYKAFDEIENRELLMEKFKRSEKMVVRRWDKARKLTYGSKLAKDAGYTYTMALDADDLLSRHLFTKLATTSANGECPGWYIKRGYVYKSSTRYFIRVPNSMHFLNGSTHIIRTNLLKIPDFNSIDWDDFNFFTDHGWIKDRLKKYMHIDLEPVDAAMVVYLVHQSNISKVKAKEYGFNLKSIIKRMIRFVPLTKRLRDEFSIPLQLLFLIYAH